MQRIISKTPVRISLFGGSTDYPDYYLRKPGAAFGITIDKYTYISLSTISHFFDYRLRLSYSRIEEVKEISDIQHPSVRACLQHKGITVPLDIHILSDLPAKTGLGSSSSFTVGFLNALYALQGKKISKQRLAEEACFIEQKVIGENVGSQDQFHASFGGMNVIEFSKATINVRPVIISSEKKKLFESHLLVFYTGLTRFANEIVKEQLDKTKGLLNDQYLERIYQMVFEAEDLVSHATLEEMMPLLGRLLHENWLLKKQLSSQISNSFVDECYEKALASGAYGGKLCGAGSGGFLALLVPPQSQDSVRSALSHLREVHFHLESEGSSIIFMKE